MTTRAAFFLFLSLKLLAEPPVDSNWPANHALESVNVFTDTSLGAAQGGTYHEGHVYLYGDVATVEPRIGLIREYTPNLIPTGRQIFLTKQGQPIARHPTGLSFDSKFGTVLGNTENRVGTIFKLDWEKALHDGNLDRAILKSVVDSEAKNGTRPLFLKVKGKTYLASADYGDKNPEVRLYDPELFFNDSPSAKAVIRRIPTEPFNQNLDFDSVRGKLILIENVVAGLGWKLVAVDVNRILDPSVKHTNEISESPQVFIPHSELEGYVALPEGKSLFITSDPKGNLIRATPASLSNPYLSRSGEKRFHPAQPLPKSQVIADCLGPLRKLN